jgi:hypothetical protein
VRQLGDMLCITFYFFGHFWLLVEIMKHSSLKSLKNNVFI